MKPAFTPLQNEQIHGSNNGLSEDRGIIPANSRRANFVTGFSVETSKIVGTPAEGIWSQVHTFFPQESGKKEKRGDLLAVLVVFGAEEGIGAVALGREILGRLHEEYYGDVEGNAFERLGEAVRKVSLENEGLEVVAASLLGKVLYLAIYGQGKILLKRGGEMGVVLQGEGDILKTGSGILQTGDLVLLGSGHFFQVVGVGVMKAALESNSLEEAVETLAPIVLGHKNMADAAVILALVKQEEPSITSISPEENELETQIESKTKPIGFFGKIVNNIKLPQKRDVFIKRADLEKKKKTLFIMAIVFLGLLGMSLSFGYRKKMAGKKQEKIKNLVDLAEDKFNQGKQIYSDKPAEGKAFIAEAKKIAEDGLILSKNSQELSLLKEQMDKFLASAGIDVYLSELPVFMDLSLIVDGGSGVSFSLLGRKLVILDQSKKKLYLLDTEKKSHEIIDYPTAEGMMVISEKNIFVLDNKGIFEISPQDKSVSLKINKEAEWKEIVGFSTFGGNLYLLDKGSKTIWRYLASGDDFGTRNNWFIGSSPDLSSAVSMAIDGSIWVLEKDKILKFTLGRQDSFSLSKMTEAFANPTKIYTLPDDQNLYVLDQGRGKVYVIDKNGEFKASYVSEGIKQANDLVAIESLKKIFLLSGAKIYEIEIK